MMKNLKNPHPGEILNEEFLIPMSLSFTDLASAIGVPSNHVRDIINCMENITADMDLRLAKFFGLSEGYWLALQNGYDLLEIRRKRDNIIEQIEPFSDAINNSVS